MVSGVVKYLKVGLAPMVAAVMAMSGPALAEATDQTRLLMAEEPGCYWCERWTAEIGPIYPKSAEGRAAPLQRFDILSPPKDVEFALPLHYTPTFILVQDGVELGRIEGYPGEDFFWGLLAQMLTRVEASRAQHLGALTTG